MVSTCPLFRNAEILYGDVRCGHRSMIALFSWVGCAITLGVNVFSHIAPAAVAAATTTADPITKFDGLLCIIEDFIKELELDAKDALDVLMRSEEYGTSDPLFGMKIIALLINNEYIIDCMVCNC